jgi:hypothetical protein
MANGARSAPVCSDNVEIDATASPRGVGGDAYVSHSASTPMTLRCQEQRLLAENWIFIQFSAAPAESK